MEVLMGVQIAQDGPCSIIICEHKRLALALEAATPVMADIGVFPDKLLIQFA